MILPGGSGDPEERGLYAASVNGDWKILEWRGSIWSYPGTPIVWRLEDVQQWFGPLDCLKLEYDL